MAVDPTYPLYPVLCILSACFMFLVLTHSFIRQSWNLAVTLLCVGLFLDNLTLGINAIVWRDNTDIKVPVYCDLVSRLQFFMRFLPSMTSLLITRKLYIISKMRDFEPPSGKTKLINSWVEWGWGLAYPILMTAVVYTLCQDARFIVDEGFGCAFSASNSWFSIVVILIVPAIPPLISIFFYCPLVIRTVYIQRKGAQDFFLSNGSISRTPYLRILALGCLDAVIIFPIAVINLLAFFCTLTAPGTFPGYIGWAANHADFSPVGIAYDSLTDTPWDTFNTYFDNVQAPLLAIAIFALFGLTSSARAAYWSRISVVTQLLGFKPRARAPRHSVSQTTDGLTFAPPSVPQKVTFQGHTTFTDSEMRKAEGLGNADSESQFTSTASTQDSKIEPLVV
ncbi:pheromone A receptor-domain-containing protein [Mycena alexandri]|uniref:Pheromone A receptor-domain-containing protein n=1 Tax=Mycena alexandri TaxID=1745969 RepID=A0AAD6WZ66_9AGAR|nr:pheromone A receptor-domain-containing protein [Mycena alexandri]